MQSSNHYDRLDSLKPPTLVRHCKALLVIVLVLSTQAVHRAYGQVAPAADTGGVTVYVGATASGYEFQYGHQDLVGASEVMDADTRRRIGFEEEARWLIFHQTNGLHATTILGGPRYHYTRDNLQFYVKGLLGLSRFTFPYNYAKGNYLAIASGGGFDYRWNSRISIRCVDLEYQVWPNFTYGQLTSFGLSSGLRVRVF
jgi:hypothetical protein